MLARVLTALIVSMVTPSAMERETAQSIAASFVGSWHGTGFVDPCNSVEAWYNIHPADTSDKHVLAGYARLRMCGVCPIGRLELKGVRSASGLSFTSYSRNVSKAEFEPGGAPVNLTGTFTSLDSSNLTVQFRLDGDQSARMPNSPFTATLLLTTLLPTVQVARAS